MTIKIRRLISAVLFCVVTLLCISKLSTLQKDPHQSNWDYDDSYPYEVLWIGSSHIYRTIIPQFLYDNYGIASLSLSTSGQTSYHTLTTLQDLKNLAQMKVVIMDVFAFLRPYTYSADFNHSLTTTDPSKIAEDMKPSRYTLSSSALRQLPEYDIKKYIRLLGEKEMDIPLQYYFSFFQSHSQYLHMDRDHFESSDRRFVRHLNYSPSYSPWPLEDPFLNDLIEDPSVSINSQCYDYLLRIIELCQKKNVPLLLTAIPYDVSNAERIVLDQIAQIAEEHDVAFIDMETIVDDSFIEWENDFMDHGHTNHFGAVKVTDFFGDYLTTYYDLEDRLESDSDDSPFLKNQYGYDVDEILFTNREYLLTDYLESLYNLDDTYYVILTTGDDNEYELEDHQLNILHELGFELSKEPSEGSYLMQINKGWSPVYRSDQAILTNIAAHTIEVTNEIYIDNQTVSVSGSGCKLVIFDPYTHSVIDSIAFGNPNTEEVRR